jgi:hypothetical protein
MRQLISFYPLSPILHIIVCLLFTCCCCVSASPARHKLIGVSNSKVLTIGFACQRLQDWTGLPFTRHLIISSALTVTGPIPWVE